MSPPRQTSLPFILLLLVPLCLLSLDASEGLPRTSETPSFLIEPRPEPQHEAGETRDGHTSDLSDVEFLSDFKPSDEDRNVGYCTDALVKMNAGHQRKFWSYGHEYLKEPYPANCSLKYIFTTKLNPADTYAKYGFRVTGTFVGPNIAYTTCTETDYVTINDTEGITAEYCGTSATISFETGSNYIEFYFISQENSPRAKGFFVTIESFYLCGGLINSDTHGPTGSITSPQYGSDYMPNTNCFWWFTTNPETSIRMECMDFLLEDRFTFDNGTSYCPDYFAISYEAISSTTTTSYCNGDLSERTIFSAGSTMLVNFRSDANNHFSGFNCSYDFIHFGY